MLRHFRISRKTLPTVTEPHRSPSPETNSSSVWLVPVTPLPAPNIVLNTIVAEAFRDACDVLEGAENFEDAVHDLIKKNLSEHQRTSSMATDMQMSG